MLIKLFTKNIKINKTKKFTLLKNQKYIFLKLYITLNIIKNS